MEKTLTIDGKEVRFKSTAATPLRYKAQFGKDFFAEIFKLESLEKLMKPKSGKLKAEDFSLVDFDVLYNIVWTMAKTADPKIPDPITWLDGFDEFPLMEIFPELQDMIVRTIQGKKK
ncbi:hypothetical protein [Melghirimyces algeriensis]|uniref:Prophage pi2 protein 40 n=1 Tax=Melghirimyces algeriensis TaxID=910412 RepID=A0A521C6E5_9BACL|nr:hypothetical protein [Melghirimyces algeriensis]SMO55067.1 hypothetical protein SAMN06264849_103156 [Melghirimyces algeriensis]